jgi:DNA-directed RNA polymerase subunit RPC12/RpoP
MDRPEYSRRLDFDELQYEQLVNAGIAAVKGHEREAARRMLFKAAEMKPTDPEPWLWLSATTDDPDEQRDYLEHAVAADPGNAAARRGLVLLSGKVDKSRLLDEGQHVAPRHPTQPEQAAAAQIFLCQECGGHMRYDTQRAGLLCEYCGFFQPTEAELTADTSEQVLDFILPTTRGHRWAEAQHNLTCERCGSVSILPAGQKAGECPYCGSRRLIESAETLELIDPQVIGLAQIDEAGAVRQVREWLGHGWFIPGDLRRLALTSSLRPAYYPFWTFDGTLELGWSCEVNEGSGSSGWTALSGVEFEMFDDELVPGLRAMQKIDLKLVAPFELKKVVAFKPEHLAGWTALTYDLPLAEASLKAREKVARRLRQQIHHRVEVGYQKRNLRSGATRWSGVTFKLVLLPLWVGTYTYRKRKYWVLVNGQTGKVGGARPRDPLAIFGFSASLFFTLLLAAFLLLYLAFSQGWIIKPWINP